jgi:hypothetical protein
MAVDWHGDCAATCEHSFSVGTESYEENVVIMMANYLTLNSNSSSGCLGAPLARTNSHRYEWNIM